jgi:hypothetical protein
VARTWWAHPQQEARPEPRDAADWLRANGVTLTAVILIVIQLWLKAALLAHSYFKQDDFRFLDRALANGFSWHYLMWVEAGHLLPVGFAIAWLLARVSLYNWPLACAVTLLILAAACFAMLAMLRTVFGNRPAILIPLTLYLFGPLSLAGLDWWAVSLEVLPLELAIFMAIRAHVRYLRNGRLSSAAAATGWLAFGMASMVKGAVVPFLLLALTAAFFMTAPGPDGQPAPRHLGAAIVATLTRYWRAWLMYAALLAGYCAVFFLQLPTSSSQPAAPTSVGQVTSFVSTLFSTSLLPGAVGGPWRWWAVGYAQAGPPAALEQLSWVVAAAVVAVSCIYRVRAWRSWAILLGWIVLADIVPVILGRMGTQPGSLLGTQTRYLTDAMPILALCVGLAFLPVAGEQHAYRFRFQETAETAEAADPAARTVLEATAVPVLQTVPVARRWARVAAGLLLGAFLVGSFVSLQGLESVTKPAAVRDYIETAQIAVAHAPTGTLIVNASVPATVMDPAYFWRQGYTSQVIGAIARGEPARHLNWTLSPRGVIPSLMMFNQQGQLSPVTVAGPSSVPPPQPRPQPHGKHTRGKHRTAPVPVNHCWTATAAGIRVPLNGSLYRWPWTTRLDYTGPATELAVSFGVGWQTVTLPAGQHSVYVPTVGSGGAIGVRLLSAGPAACITNVTVGSLQPDAAAQAIPPTPASG